MAELANESVGSLKGYDCPLCKNRGWSDIVDGKGRVFSKPCACMEVRRSLKRIEKSGLKDMLERYTLENWKAPERWQRDAAAAARRYAEERSGWFLMAGAVGAGKTHLCTALCGLLLAGGLPVRYVLWRDLAVRAKAAVNDGEVYQKLVDPLKRVRVLYIDDLFKTGKGAEPTSADVNLAFEILNRRYNDKPLLTIISTERTIGELLAIDEAVGSRIYERAKNYNLDLSGKKDWRLR